MTAAYRLAQPAAADHLAAEGAFALSRAMGSCRKAVAQRLGRSVDVLDKYLAGDNSSPVVRFDALLIACDYPFALVTHVRSVAIRWSIRTQPTAELVARFHEIMALESAAEGRENSVAQCFYRTGDLLMLAEADEAEMALQEERAGICRELSKRKVDPRTYEGTK